MTTLFLYEMLEVMYPTLRVDHIQDPSRLYAVPLLGILIKVIICMPIFLEFLLLGIANVIITWINSFCVLFTGTYWDVAYELTLALLRLTTKLGLFFSGLTNKYPGFSLSIEDSLISLDMVKPLNPNRFFAFPLIGGVVRIVLLMPFTIYMSIIGRAGGIGVFFSSLPVLFSGRYPESTYELARDATRLSLASSVYGVGLSDSYPNFWISMNHQTIKIILIILGVMGLFANVGSSLSSSSSNPRYVPHNVIQPSPFNQYTPGLQTQ